VGAKLVGGEQNSKNVGWDMGFVLAFK